MQYQAHIGIIGGGFSGLMTLHHLVRTSRRPLFIRMYDEHGRAGKGLAYSTRDPSHLLNVPAINMGALPGQPDDFYLWLSRHPEKWQSLHPSFSNREFTPGSFVPRMIYGAYLEFLLQQILQNARRSHHRVELHALGVTHIDEHLSIRDSAGGTWRADRVVLAIGHFGSRQLPFKHLNDNGAVLRDPWNTGASRFWQEFDQREWPAHAHVVVLGTGLSSVDMLHTLSARAFRGKITAISRHGLLPEPHQTRNGELPRPDILEYPRTALELCRKLDADIRQLTAEGRDWRGVIDGIRSATNSLWSLLPPAERQDFLQNHLSWWNSLRHRMPPESREMISELQFAGRLQVHTGRLVHVSRMGKKLTLFVLNPGEETPVRLTADAVINAMGFTSDVMASNSELLLALRAQQLIQAGDVPHGIPTDGEHRVRGKVPHRIYALGPVLFGERLETTAVPELRQQALHVAATLLFDLEQSTGKLPLHSRRAAFGSNRMHSFHPWPFEHPAQRASA